MLAASKSICRRPRHAPRRTRRHRSSAARARRTRRDAGHATTVAPGAGPTVSNAASVAARGTSSSSGGSCARCRGERTRWMFAVIAPDRPRRDDLRSSCRRRRPGDRARVAETSPSPRETRGPPRACRRSPRAACRAAPRRARESRRRPWHVPSDGLRQHVPSDGLRQPRAAPASRRRGGAARRRRAHVPPPRSRRAPPACARRPRAESFRADRALRPTA